MGEHCSFGGALFTWWSAAHLWEHCSFRGVTGEYRTLKILEVHKVQWQNKPAPASNQPSEQVNYLMLQKLCDQMLCRDTNHVGIDNFLQTILSGFWC